VFVRRQAVDGCLLCVAVPVGFAAASCQPATIPNGALSCANTASGQTCAGSCSSGYTGTPVGTCINGAWSVSGSCSLAGELTHIIQLAIVWLRLFAWCCSLAELMLFLRVTCSSKQCCSVMNDNMSACLL
jgi:hypothetical protein